VKVQSPYLRTRIVRLAVFLVVLVGSNTITAYVVKKNARPKVDHARDMVEALAKMSEANGRFVVILGDSITQNAKRLPKTVCGALLINAGIGGSHASGFISFAEEMTARQLKPLLVVLALGVNDALDGYRADFASTYSVLIDALPEAPLALATLAPVDRSLPEGARLNPSVLLAVNGVIRETAITRGAALIDLNQIKGLKTKDGIHPDETTYPVWNAAIISGIEGALKCNDPRRSQAN